jgi:transcriptional regulator GlxA family with amidase domain
VELLSNRSLSIDEVAKASGFGNVRSLRRAFVAAKGMSPQAYRNLLPSDPQAA